MTLIKNLKRKRKEMDNTEEYVRVPLTDAEIERLDILVEECAEVILAVSAIKRFGYEGQNPELLPISCTNREALTREMGDVMNAMNLVMDARDVDAVHVSERSAKKAVQIKKWLNHN